MGIYRKSHCTIEEKRNAVALVRNGHAVKDVAARFNVSKSAVHTWRCQSDAGELESAVSKKRAMRDAMSKQDVTPADDSAVQHENIQMNPESVSLGTLRSEFASARIIEQMKADKAELEDENALLRSVCLHFLKKTSVKP